jgi:hypothetical protein
MLVVLLVVDIVVVLVVVFLVLLLLVLVVLLLLLLILPYRSLLIPLEAPTSKMANSRIQQGTGTCAPPGHWGSQGLQTSTFQKGQSITYT